MSTQRTHGAVFARGMGGRPLRAVLAAILLLAPFAGVASSWAAPSAPTFTVNDTADLVGAPPLNDSHCAAANGHCTLRAAIMEANHTPGGGATIILPSGTYVLQLAPAGADDEASGDLNISQTVTLRGAGAAATIVDGNTTDRVFNITTAGAVVSLSGLTIQHGAADSGGGVLNAGQLTLSHATVNANQATDISGEGGGIDNRDVLSLTDSLISGNTAGSIGGGLFNADFDSLSVLRSTVRDNGSTIFGGGIGSNGPDTILNSTVDDNHAQNGGGFYQGAAGLLTMINSTISNNSADNSGGGVFDDQGSANLYQSTVAGNLADRNGLGAGFGGGIYFSNSDPFSLWNTLLADNSISSTSNECFSLTSQDYNYFQTTAGCGLILQSHDRMGGDPLLGPLQDNGGPTLTRALWASSPALDRIPVGLCGPSGTAPVPDQRGMARPINGLCDIGAVEGAVPLVLLNRNLVRNGDAEAAAGSPVGAFVGVPDWRSGGGPLITAALYNGPGGFPSVPTDTVPAIHGYNLFAGGLSGVAVGQQDIDLSPLAASIDSGGVSYDFSADLGGYKTQDDNAMVEADFLNGSSQVVLQTILGPVMAADRGGVTGLIHRDDSALVPAHTRTVVLYITLTNTGSGYNDGYADNVSLVLTLPYGLDLPLALR